MRHATVIRLRSRCDRPGLFHASPNKTLSVYSASAGATSANGLFVAGLSVIMISLSYDVSLSSGIASSVTFSSHSTDFAVFRLLNCDVRHRRRRCRAVPVLLVGGACDDIAGTYFDLWLAFALRPTEAGGDDQGLTARMGVPCRSRARLECDQATAELRRPRRLEQGIDPDIAGKFSAGPLTDACEPLRLSCMGCLLVQLYRYASALLDLISKNGMWL